jgi:hypothetical protein
MVIGRGFDPIKLGGGGGGRVGRWAEIQNVL